MKNFQPIELKKASAYLEMPPVGAYVAEIKNARIVEASGNQQYDKLEMMIDITEGEYKGRFTAIFNDQKERGYEAKYKGIYRLSLPTEGQDNEKVSAWVSNQLFCVFDSNAKPGGTKEYRWSGDLKELIGKAVGINMRKKLYNYTNRNGEVVEAATTEIGKLETVDDVKTGKCKTMKERDSRTVKKQDGDSTDGSGFTDVSKSVDVPW